MDKYQSANDAAKLVEKNFTSYLLFVFFSSACFSCLLIVKISTNVGALKTILFFNIVIAIITSLEKIP